MKDLKPCPCGSKPDKLGISTGSTGRWAYCFCPECGDWAIEFRLNYVDPGSSEAQQFAIEAWNKAPRKQEE